MQSIELWGKTFLQHWYLCRSAGEEGIRVEIKDIIRRKEIDTIEKDATVADAIGRLVTRDAESIIVKRSNPHDAYGMVTRRDILVKVIAKGLDPRKVKVTEIMTSPLVILNNIELDVRHAAQAMANAGVSTIVIFDKGDIYGFLSADDIIGAMSKKLLREHLDSKM